MGKSQEYEAVASEWIEQRARELRLCTADDVVRQMPGNVVEAIRMTEMGVGSWLAVLAGQGKLTEVVCMLPNEAQPRRVYLPAGTYVTIREGSQQWETKLS